MGCVFAFRAVTTMQRARTLEKESIGEMTSCQGWSPIDRVLGPVPLKWAILQVIENVKLNVKHQMSFK